MSDQNNYRFYRIPEEFLSDAFLEDPVMMKLIRYIFRRIKYTTHTEVLKNNRTQKKITLQPFEFIFGRLCCSKECGVGEKQIRTRMAQLSEMGFIKRASSSAAKGASSSASSSASTYSIYTLVTSSFSKIRGQQFGQQFGQQMGQQLGHKLDTKIEILDEIDKIDRIDCAQARDKNLTTGVMKIDNHNITYIIGL